MGQEFLPSESLQRQSFLQTQRAVERQKSSQVMQQGRVKSLNNENVNPAASDHTSDSSEVVFIGWILHNSKKAEYVPHSRRGKMWSRGCDRGASSQELTLPLRTTEMNVRRLYLLDRYCTTARKMNTYLTQGEGKCSQGLRQGCFISGVYSAASDHGNECSEV